MCEVFVEIDLNACYIASGPICVNFFVFSSGDGVDKILGRENAIWIILLCELFWDFITSLAGVDKSL